MNIKCLVSVNELASSFVEPENACLPHLLMGKRYLILLYRIKSFISLIQHQGSHRG